MLHDIAVLGRDDAFNAVILRDRSRKDLRAQIVSAGGQSCALIASTKARTSDFVSCSMKSAIRSVRPKA